MRLKLIIRHQLVRESHVQSLVLLSMAAIQYRYLSFSFTDQDDGQEQSVVCDLKFCLQGKCPTITCT